MIAVEAVEAVEARSESKVEAIGENNSGSRVKAKTESKQRKQKIVCVCTQQKQLREATQ